MAATKSTTVMFSNTSLTAGAGPTNSSAATLTTGFGASVFLKLTNGVAGPYTAASLRIEVSPDGTNYYDLSGGSEDLTGTTTNSDVVSKHVELPIGIGYVRVVATHGSTQAVTARAEVNQVTAIS